MNDLAFRLGKSRCTLKSPNMSGIVRYLTMGDKLRIIIFDLQPKRLNTARSTYFKILTTTQLFTSKTQNIMSS